MTIDWIGLREHLQETIDFHMKIMGLSVIFPLNQSIDKMIRIYSSKVRIASLLAHQFFSSNISWFNHQLRDVTIKHEIFSSWSNGFLSNDHECQKGLLGGAVEVTNGCFTRKKANKLGLKTPRSMVICQCVYIYIVFTYNWNSSSK